MGSGDFWSQSKKRFNLDVGSGGINLNDASAKLNIAKNKLASIFSKNDKNQKQCN